MSDMTQDEQSGQAAELMHEARTQITALVEAAESGALVPIRLPAQLKQIGVLIEQAQMAQQEQTASGPALPADLASMAQDTAEFFKVALHELRTPMTSIRGYSDMLSNPGMAGEMSEMQAQLLAVIRANSRRMESLLSDVSYMNKLRAGILFMKPKMDMFKNIAMMVEKKARPLAQELSRQFETEVPDGLPLLNTDGETLAHALFKLIENGLRYSAEGEGRVVMRGARDENTLVVTVSDNGIGMSAEELAQYGTPFFRADDDRVRAFKGSGLGAPIALGLVEALGGSLLVTSTLGEGTTITVRMPGMG